MAKYYLITTSPENNEIDRTRLGFTVQGLKEKHKNTVKKWNPGDRMVYYINKIGKLGAIAEIVSGYFRDEERIWSDENELWPRRWISA